MQSVIGGHTQFTSGCGANLRIPTLRRDGKIRRLGTFIAGIDLDIIRLFLIRFFFITFRDNFVALSRYSSTSFSLTVIHFIIIMRSNKKRQFQLREVIEIG